jgi:hypothetical protein
VTRIVLIAFKSRLHLHSPSTVLQSAIWNSSKFETSNWQRPSAAVFGKLVQHYRDWQSVCQPPTVRLHLYSYLSLSLSSSSFDSMNELTYYQTFNIATSRSSCVCYRRSSSDTLSLSRLPCSDVQSTKHLPHLLHVGLLVRPDCLMPSLSSVSSASSGRWLSRLAYTRSSSHSLRHALTCLSLCPETGCSALSLCSSIFQSVLFSSSSSSSSSSSVFREQPWKLWTSQTTRSTMIDRTHLPTLVASSALPPTTALNEIPNVRNVAITES